MNFFDRQPIFELRLQAIAASFFLEMNGVSMLKEYDNFASIETILPVNQWIRSGQNVLGLYVLPEEDGEEVNPGSNVNVELWVRTSTDESGFKVASIDFKGKLLESNNAVSDSTPSGRFASGRNFFESDDGDVKVENISLKEIPEYEGRLLFERGVSIPCGLPEWAFFSSDLLPDYDHMSDNDYLLAKDELFLEYKKLQQLILKGDVDAVVALASERSRETDKAFYLTPGTTESKLKTSLESSIKDADLELAELLPDYVDIRVEDNRKLVRLVRGDESSAIGFNFKSFGGSLSYDFFVRREGGKWIVTR